MELLVRAGVEEDHLATRARLVDKGRAPRAGQQEDPTRDRWSLYLCRPTASAERPTP